MNSEKRVQAAIAGLLHDIGKLEQRARSDPWNTAPGVDREGQPVHATWTTYFIQNNVPEAYRKAAYAGAYHHQPEKSPAEDQSLSMVVALADKLSAGERADPDEKKDQVIQQMVSIFDRLMIAGQAKQADWHYLPLQPLTLDENAIFPGKQVTKDACTEAYEKLRSTLAQIAKADPGEANAYLENLLGGMQATTWCVPSAYYHSVPDVSLYDHSRMTAALAACLADLEPARIQELLAAVRQEFSGKVGQAEQKILAEPLVLLIGGDLSGVQDFIYTISSKNAAKTLRGRSFYLQLLTEAALRFALRELGLPYTNVIYSGGGHFFLLAPISAESSLPGLREQITRKLLKHHGINLYLAIAGQPVPADGFKIGQFPRYWNAMHRSLAQAKQQRYAELGHELYEKVFAVATFGGNPEQNCSVCGEDHRAVKQVYDEDDNEQIRVCTLCSSFDEQIGRQLPQAKFAALGITGPIATEPGTAASALQEFGMKFTFIESRHDSIDLSEVGRVVLWALEDPNQGWPASSGVPTSHILRYTVNRIPQDTFDTLQKKVSSGFHRLGVLRMDVDNLGTIFSDGFGAAGHPENRATLARLSTLSFEISLFFEGWVKKLCEEQRDKIYSVYAGGDDLFLIGPWDIIPKLARQIYRDFARYTSGHPDLHVSGGMAFMGGKYPVYQAARDAEEAENLAKNKDGKNAFSFLGQAWKWTDFEQIAAQQERLVHLVSSARDNPENLGGPQAILGTLRQLAASEARAAEKTSRPVWGPWMWIGAYQLKRMAERYEKTQPELAAEIDRIREELGANNYADIQMWGAAARWAQLATRKSMNQD